MQKEFRQSPAVCATAFGRAAGTEVSRKALPRRPRAHKVAVRPSGRRVSPTARCKHRLPPSLTLLSSLPTFSSHFPQLKSRTYRAAAHPRSFGYGRRGSGKALGDGEGGEETTAAALPAPRPPAHPCTQRRRRLSGLGRGRQRLGQRQPPSNLALEALC